MSLPCFAKSAIWPGPGRPATSGGFPPPTRVASTALRSLVPSYWTLMPVLSSNGFTIARNESCSAPPHVPRTETVLLPLLPPVVVPPDWHAASTIASATESETKRVMGTSPPIAERRGVHSADHPQVEPVAARADLDRDACSPDSRPSALRLDVAGRERGGGRDEDREPEKTERRLWRADERARVHRLARPVGIHDLSGDRRRAAPHRACARGEAPLREAQHGRRGTAQDRRQRMRAGRVSRGHHGERAPCDREAEVGVHDRHFERVQDDERGARRDEQQEHGAEDHRRERSEADRDRERE